MNDNSRKYIKTFNWQHLTGRIWQMDSVNPRARNHLIIVIYGHHSSLERNSGVIEYLRTVGNVLAMDLPGFGGMDSFYKINKKPTIDNFAYYLNNILEIYLKPGQTFSLIGFCFGFLITTRMLQMYPKWQPRVRLNVSLVGFLHGNHFTFSKRRRMWYNIGAKLITWPIGVLFFRYIVLSPFILKRFYARTSLAKAKFDSADKDLRKKLLNIEIKLWHCNDVKTWAFTSLEMMNCDLLKESINLDVYHLATTKDQYFNHDLNALDFKKVYKNVIFVKMNLDNHAPTMIIDQAEAQKIIPKQMITILEKEYLKDYK